MTSCNSNPYTAKTSVYSTATNPYTAKTSVYDVICIQPALLQENGFPLLQENGYNLLI